VAGRSVRIVWALDRSRGKGSVILRSLLLFAPQDGRNPLVHGPLVGRQIVQPGQAFVPPEHRKDVENAG
jgi:hypothetical protein